MPGLEIGQLESLLELNRNTNKPNIDMEPLFEWGVEEDGEQTLKALPYVIDWFKKADEVIADVSPYQRLVDGHNVDRKRLNAINQFARAMPLLFEGIAKVGTVTK